MRRIRKLGRASAHFGLLLGGVTALLAWVALANVFAGSNAIDLFIEPADLTIHVDDASDYLGSSVASGDVNGDGVDDLIVGSFGADASGRPNAGAVYIVYGNESLPSLLDIPKTGADVTILGANADDFFGFASASGDVNGDGIDDIIVSARLADPLGRVSAGEVYIFLGKSDLPAIVDLASERPDIVIQGSDIGDQTGYSLAVGDLNGDGLDDTIIGAFLGDRPERTNAGETVVVYGRSLWPNTIDLRLAEDVFVVYGRNQEDRAGWAVASGDLNGDGVDDLIIGARLAELPGDDETGETYVIYGSTDPLPNLDLSVGEPDLVVYGRVDGDRSANSVGAGDINGDGIDDLLIGAHHASPPGRSNAGETYVLFGGNLPSMIDLATEQADVTIFGANAFDHFGVTVVAGDLNADGFEDLVSGAFGADGPGILKELICGDEEPGDRCLAGEAHVIFGSAQLPDLIDLNSEQADVAIYGAGVRNFSGYTLAVGDLNGDSIPDLVFGARLAHMNIVGPAGDIHILFGGEGFGPPCPDCPTATAQPSATPTPTPTPFLILARLGDVNCDDAVNSIDALLVLQFTAALLPSLDCLEAGDVNADLSVDSLDAVLILQIVAGAGVA